MSTIDQVHPVVTPADALAVHNYLLSGGWCTEFDRTAEFAQKIEQFIGVAHASLCPNGTIGLYLALLAAGIGPGKRVAVPNYTMIATINAVRMVGATPVIIDIDKNNWCMSAESLLCQEGSLDAVIFVEINGRKGNLEQVLSLCRTYNWILIEDSCQAFGSGTPDKKYGSFGDLGVFSFSPHKIITTGQGGAVVTNNENYYERIEALRDFGRTRPGVDQHTSLGYNFKFTDMQAVLGLSQLETIDTRIKIKHLIHEIYTKQLEGEPVSIKSMGAGEVPWFIELLLPYPELREPLVEYLRNLGIQTRRCYPPINRQPIYCSGEYAPNSEVVNCGLWLPSSVDLSEENIVNICGKIKSFSKWVDSARG